MKITVLQNFIEKFGFPVAVASVLLFFIISVVNTSLADIKTKLSNHDANVVLTLEAVTASKEDTKKQTVLLQMICRNTAKNEFQSAQCDK